MVAPSGLNGGGGAPKELIITWAPMTQEYQNGDGFGYIMVFRKKGTVDWQTAKVPGPESMHYVYHNESIVPYTPFEVKVKAYNRKGEGPESLAAVVYSAEDEPRVAPSNVSAKALSASDMDVTWKAVEEEDINGVLQGYEMLYRLDSHSTSTLHLTTKTRMDLTLPEDASHVTVQIRATGVGGDGVPAEVHIPRDSGTSMMVDNSSANVVKTTAVTCAVIMLALIGML